MNMNNDLAPVTLFVYNRPEHTRKTIEALQKNFLAKNSELFIFSDGPKNEDAKENVEKVREHIRTIVGFKDVTIIEREKNLGLAKSIISGVTEIINRYGKIIVMEDDLVSSPYFLQYMNEALVFYEDEEKVISIHGYVYPVKGVLPETFFLKGADCWGWATWKRGWELFKEDGQKLLDELKKRGLEKEFDFQGTYPYTQMLEDQIAGKNSSWAILWYASAFLNNKLTLYPGKSLINNIGLDDQGTHCGVSDKFSVPLSKEPIKISRIKIEENQMANDEIRNFFKVLRPRPSLLKILNSRNRREQFNYIARRFVPPILIDVARWLKNSGIKQEVPEWEYLPGGWQENIRGWNVGSVLEEYKRKWPDFVKSVDGNVPLGIAHEANEILNDNLYAHNSIMTYAYVLALASRNKGTLSILDWGGGIGHYYLLARALLPNVRIDYHCKDVPVLAEYGAQLFPEQHFYTDDSCLERTYDVVMANTSMHYIEDWQGLLADLAGATQGHLYITGLPTVLHAPSFVFVQRAYAYGYNTEYQGWCLNREEFLKCAEAARLDLLREFLVGHKPFIHRAPEQNEYRGFLFRSAGEGLGVNLFHSEEAIEYD
jgi:putative methyltransferase (TIGR04325 family)